MLGLLHVHTISIIRIDYEIIYYIEFTSMRCLVREGIVVYSKDCNHVQTFTTIENRK